MNTIPDYSQVEDFNLAATAAFRAARESHKEGEYTGEAVYNYKGRKLKIKYDAFLDESGNLDGVGITYVEEIKGE